MIGRPGRIVTVKSKLMGKSMECNVVMLTVNALRYFEHRNLFCCEVTWNERASSMVMQSHGHCSLWKRISHTDGRQVDDLTKDVIATLSAV